jgi:predicted membrane-bound mannosyltransferase
MPRFYVLEVWLYIYFLWRKKIVGKAVLKMLVTLTAVVNFTNFFRAHLRQLSCTKKSSNLICKYNKPLRETFVQKAARKMLVKLTTVEGVRERKRDRQIEKQYLNEQEKTLEMLLL